MIRALLLAGVAMMAAPALPQSVAIVGGTVHTVGPEGTLEGATIVITDGRIAAVGRDAPIPPGAERIDATGKIVTPGLFTPYGTLGLADVGFSGGPLDAVQRGNQFTASFDVADGFNPRSVLVPVNRIEGVTRALIAPAPTAMDAEGQRSHVISGLAAVVNLSGDADSIDRRGAAVVVNLGESGIPYGGTSRVSALMLLASALAEARDFAENRDAWERGQHRDYAFSAADLEALQAVLAGEVPLLVRVNRASDIARLLQLAEEEGVRVIVNGGAEAWLLAGALAAARVPVIMAPEDNLPASFDALNARGDAAGILAAAGVQLAFADGSAHTHNARNITQSAGNAIVAGLSPEAALRAITLNPAEMFGVADRVGSLEPGKEGDVVIWPGDPFELSNYPDAVLVRGEVVPMHSRQTLLRDRYLRPDAAVPPAYRNGGR